MDGSLTTTISGATTRHTIVKMAELFLRLNSTGKMPGPFLQAIIIMAPKVEWVGLDREEGSALKRMQLTFLLINGLCQLQKTSVTSSIVVKSVPQFVSIIAIS